MSIRSAHGSARASGRLTVVETPVADELAAPVPDPSTPVQPGRDRFGRYVAGAPETREAARQAGRSRHGRTRLATTLGVATDDPAWAAHLRVAESWRRAAMRELARESGGRVSNTAGALVGNAALALAGSRRAYSEGDTVQGERFAAAMKQHLLAATELAARSAQATRGADDAERLREALRPRGVDDEEDDEHG